MSSNIKVGIKLRPLIKQETDENLSIQWTRKGNSIVSLNKRTRNGEEYKFNFDYVFDINETSTHIFDSIVKPIADGAIDGYNGTIFCYGQTGSGKTYTMIGTLEEPGMTNKFCIDIFPRVSYLEVYNNKINDLLSKMEIDLKLYKDDSGEPIIKCKEEVTNSRNSMLSIMKEGMKNKKILEINRTECIDSHSIFRIIIESQGVEEDSENTVQVSQLNFVDLAGLKKIHCTDNTEDHQTDLSLSYLESQIKLLNKLENFNGYSDSYDSKLTALLKSSLNHNAMIAIICTVIPVTLEETYYTLQFASQVMKIHTKPIKNDGNTSLLVSCAKQLAKLEAELERMKNENMCIEFEEFESNKLQQKELEERINLLKSYIISGCAKNSEESHMHKFRRRQLWYNPGKFKQHLSMYYNKSGLPTIKEMSPEKPYKKNIMQSMDVINQSQTAFTDLELESTDYDAVFESNKYSALNYEHLNCTDDECEIRLMNNNCFLTPKKQDSSVQTSSNYSSPSTPKNVLRSYIWHLTKDLTELREFTTLEKQIMSKENHCCVNTEAASKQPTCSNIQIDEITQYNSNLIAELVDEKVKLTEELEVKVQELNDIKNDIRSLKLDIEKLDETILVLTNENMEMSSKLSAEKERSKQAEMNLQKIIDDLYIRISKITDEKINLEGDISILNEQLKSVWNKTTDYCNDNQLIIDYRTKIDMLKAENIKLSAIIADQNKELDSIKECKSLLYDHECRYKDEIMQLKEQNENLVTENYELSTNLIHKNEENDMLKEQCDILKSKISLIENTSSDANDQDQLRSENNLLKAEILELKMRMTILSDENAKFSHSLLESIENLDNSHNENLSTNMLHISTDEATLTTRKEAEKEMSYKENYENLANKVTIMQDKMNHLSRLNNKLSDLKLSSCNQCAHLKNLNENRIALKLEAKKLNHKLQDLQKKFDQKCADTEALKLKANQELNLSFTDTSLNVSFADGMNVTFMEEKVQHLNNELQILKNDHDGCDELEKHHDVVDSKYAYNHSKSKNHMTKNESRIEEIQKSIDQVKEDIDELKKNSTNFASVLNKFRVKKASLLDEINTLKNVNEELQQKVLDKEILETTATEKALLLESELLNKTKEIEQYSMQEKIIRNEKLTLEVELEDLKAEQESKDILITGLHRTIDDLNDCISSLKTELDLVTNEKSELTLTAERIERKYKDELEYLRMQYNELEREKQESKEAETRATLWAKELENDVEKLQTDLDKQESLYKKLQTKVLQLENLLQESKNENASLKAKLQALEIQLVDSKDNMVIKYKNELETLTKNFEEYTKESEIKISKINETLNKYAEENHHLAQELTRLQDIESKLKNLQTQDERVKELDVVKEHMITELKSLKCKVNSADFLNKTADAIFIMILQAVMLKEEELIKETKELFEKDKQKLLDEVRQSADAEKRGTLWIKELEAEIYKLQTDLTSKEQSCKDYQDKLNQLEHLLKENTYEKEILKEKMHALETDFNNLQGDFHKQCKLDIHRKEETLIAAQKREKEAQEAFKAKEIEFQYKMKSEINTYERRITELTTSIDSYKKENMELKNTLEDLETNEKQLKNIIEANNCELKTNSQTIEKLTLDLEQLTEAYNEVNHDVEQKTARIENITALLKSKCDMLSEYKAKLDLIIPDYEVLQNQVKERKENIERYKEEIEDLKMEKEKQIHIIEDKLNAEEIKIVGLNKQLAELNNKNIALVEEFNNLKEKNEELQRSNARMQRKIRNSTSKVKAEEEMDELKDLNKRLQNSLEGASNRITELQKDKNKILTELVNLKAQFELLSQENADVKQTLTMYKSKQALPSLFNEDNLYQTLVQEKNKIALELEGKKLLLNQKDKEMNERTDQLKELAAKKVELDDQLNQYASLLHLRDMEIVDLKQKLEVQQCENELIRALEEKLKTLERDNIQLGDQLKSFNKEKSDIRMKPTDYDNKLGHRSNCGSLKPNSPAFSDNRRRRCRNELFNLGRQLENVTSNINENDETCRILRKKIQELELQLVSKNGQIATLEIQIQSENFPYQQKCKELEELLLACRQKNSELNSETRNLHRTLNDISAWECDTCRRWRINRREQACQTSPTAMQQRINFNGIINDNIKVMKLEKEKAIIKDICRARCRQVKDLQDKVRELEGQTISSTKIKGSLQERSVPQYLTTTQLKHIDLDQNEKSAMKENIPTSILKLANYKL